MGYICADRLTIYYVSGLTGSKSLSSSLNHERNPSISAVKAVACIKGVSSSLRGNTSYPRLLSYVV